MREILARVENNSIYRYERDSALIVDLWRLNSFIMNIESDGLSFLILTRG